MKKVSEYKLISEAYENMYGKTYIDTRIFIEMAIQTIKQIEVSDKDIKSGFLKMNETALVDAILKAILRDKNRDMYLLHLLSSLDMKGKAIVTNILHRYPERDEIVAGIRKIQQSGQTSNTPQQALSKDQQALSNDLNPSPKQHWGESPRPW